MRNHRRIGMVFILSAAIGSIGRAQTAGPEVFIARAQVLGQDAGMTATITIQIDKYTTDRDRTAMQDALKNGGYAKFLPVLRQAPAVGFVELNGRKAVVRWARQQPNDKGRSISVVTDGPLAFVGGGEVNARPREGYDLAIIQMDVDSVGIGTGTMAAAANVKPGGATGVEIGDYAEKPIKLTSVRKSFK